MTRKIVYAGALVAFCATTCLTVVANTTPEWLRYEVHTPSGATFSRGLGLHRICTSELEPRCRPFPEREDCAGDEAYFCSMWRTVGFLMTFAIVAELATVVGYVVVLAGGKVKRQAGWKVLGGLMTLVALVLVAALSICMYLLDHDAKFIVPGWHIDNAWICCTVGAGISVLCAASLSLSAYLLPPEEGYEFLEDQPVDD